MNNAFGEIVIMKKKGSRFNRATEDTIMVELFTVLTNEESVAAGPEQGFATKHQLCLLKVLQNGIDIVECLYDLCTLLGTFN